MRERPPSRRAAARRVQFASAVRQACTTVPARRRRRYACEKRKEPRLTTDHEAAARPAPSVLTRVEARALGVLIEKASTTPDLYPLTLNAVVVAANQKTNRDPILELEPGEVGHALRTLEDKGY